MNSAIDVATPVIVRTPLGISSMYTPGWRRGWGMSAPVRSLLGYAPEHLRPQQPRGCSINHPASMGLASLRAGPSADRIDAKRAPLDVFSAHRPQRRWP